MDAKSSQSIVHSNEAGQSLLEFVILIPIFVGLVIILIKVNTTIQMSIVNQKYARAQALFINQNSATYPRRDIVNASLAPQEISRMDIGVAENAYNGDNVSNGIPEASQFGVSRPGQPIVGDQAGDPNPSMGRSRVRVRTNVALCSSRRFQDVTSNVPRFVYCKGMD